MRRSIRSAVRRGEWCGRLERITNAWPPSSTKRCQSTCAQLAETPSVAAAARSDAPAWMRAMSSSRPNEVSLVLEFDMREPSSCFGFSHHKQARRALSLSTTSMGSSASGQHRPSPIGLEIDEVVEIAFAWLRGRPQNDPMVFRVGNALLLDPPPKVAGAESDCFLYGRELVVVEKNDTASTDQSPKEHEIDEHTIESVIAVNECEVELPRFGEQAR